MSALGNLVVALSLEYASFSKGIDKSDQQTLRFAKNTQDAMSKMEKSVSSYINRVVGIGAAYLSINSVYASINKQVDALAQLDDAAQKTGASVELLSKIQKTATAFGVDFAAQIEPGITKLAKGVAGLDDPSNKANAALKALGIEVRDSNGNVRDAAELYIEASKKLQTYRDDASKTALANDVLGKSGAEQLPFLNDLAENVDKFSAVSAEAAANAASLQDSLNGQKQRFDEYVQQLTIDVLPALNDMAGAFLDIQTHGNNLAKDQNVSNWADNLALTISPAYDTLVNLKNEIYSIGKSFQVVYADLAVHTARFKSLNPAAYLTGDPQKSLAEAEAFRARVLKEANQAWSETASRPRDEYEQALRARMASRPNTYASPSVAGSGSGKPSVGYVSGQDAKDAADAKAKESAAAAAQKAYDTLTNSIEKQIEAKRAEYSVTGSLSEAEKMLLDINAKRADGLLTLDAGQYKYVQSLIATWEAEIQNSEMAALRLESEKEYLTVLESATQARAEQYTTMQDETRALEEQAQAKLDEIQQLTMTKEQIDALNMARYDEQIGMLETQKAYLQTQVDRENEIELIERQIEALGILRDSVGKSEAINKSKAETAEMFGSMEQASRLVWTVFANSGDDAAKAVGKSLKASVYDLLYQMTIKKFLISIEATVSGSVANAAVNSVAGQNGVGGTSVFEKVTESLKNSNIGITNSIEKLGAFLSSGDGGIIDQFGGLLGKYSTQIADGMGYLGAAYMLSQGNIAGAVLTGIGTYFGGPIGAAIGGAIGSLFGGKVSTKKYSTGVSGVYSDGQFSSTNQSGIAGYGRALGGNDSLASVLKNYSEVVSGLFNAYGIGGNINTGIDMFQRSGKKTRAWGYFGANGGGGSVNFSSGDTAFGSSQEAMTALIEKILTQGITGLVTSSNLPEGIRALFDGLGDKESIQAILTASINIGNAQDALAKQYNLTADQAGKVSKASGLAGVQLANFANSLVATANASLTTSEQMIKQRDALNSQITALGGNASISGDLKAFDAFLKGLPKDTAAAQEQFAELFKLRTSVGSVQTAWDQVISGVNASIYDLLSPAEQAAKDSQALYDLFNEYGLQVPKTAADLAAIGQAIQQNFNAADEASIDLALAFPTLVAAFTSAKDKIIDNAREMNQFTNLADYRFYKGVANNYGAQMANDYAGVSKFFGSNAEGQSTLNGQDVSDLVALLKDLRDINKSALITQRGTTEALERIRVVGIKTTS
ncbi:hypothetical protein [Methylophilus sp. Leaf414]|uniref:hypothetical protein n=1 Tax=Methylophilus sp. Leaf414 TaxID=1736371 RepID=UPI0006FE2FAC|nr:hypothetical protein [Methylophilus sp. Leaf414]KQT37674.1 hypothetical protein ASG24_01375 [Methylophilus sp. Leaf414]